MKAAELRQKDVAGVKDEIKALQKPTLVCVCKKPRNNSAIQEL